MHIKTYKFFSQATRQAMFERVEGYINKTNPIEIEIEQLREKYNLNKIHRFDLGESANGCSPKVQEFLRNLAERDDFCFYLSEYPDLLHKRLKEQISNRFNVPEEVIMINNGSDSLIGIITRIFFDFKDIYLMPVPSFFVFEEYSERMGAIPIFLQLEEEEDYKWTSNATKEFKDMIHKFRPKVVWISNPNNPTGEFIPEMVLEEMIEYANSYNVFMVVDEAYGEYTDTEKKVFSASKLLYKYKNLVILRTFSKMYGLASARVAYLLASSPEIIQAAKLLSHPFPVSQLSIQMAEIAFEDQKFLKSTREMTTKNRGNFFKKLDQLNTFFYIPSHTNVFMLRNSFLSADELDRQLKEKGIICSNLHISGLSEKNYLRVTVRSEEENDYFFRACKQLDDKIVGGSKIEELEEQTQN